MNNCRFFLVTGILLLSSLLGSAKRKIELDKILKGTLEQVEAFIDESSMQLSVEFNSQNESVDVTVTDLQGNMVFSCKTFSGEVMALPLNKQTEYILHVYIGDICYKGVFVLE